jgi:glycosyltransferase involved in cell wall biosynthesis
MYELGWTTLFHIVFGLTAVAFLALTVKTWRHLRWVHRLPRLVASADGRRQESTPLSRGLVSVVIAARDEASRIEETVRRLLAQEDALLEVLVVDDRSTDGTGEILRRLVEDDARVRAFRVDSLPEGWLGKCHACHLAAEAATGEWILFTDADCWLKPDVLVRALLAAESEGVEHITMTPGASPRTLAARGWHLAFLISAADWLSAVNRDRPQGHFGVGAFNLVRTSLYRQCGGYEALRMTIVDDIKLGLLVRRAGGRTRAFLGGDDVDCTWGATAGSMVKIMEKNYFAAADFRVLIGPAAVAGIMLFGAAIVGPFTGSLVGLAAGGAMLTLSFPAYVLARRLGWSAAAALITPFIYPLLLYAVLNSTWVTLRQGGVRWRETFYSLEALRREGVR